MRIAVYCRNVSAENEKFMVSAFDTIRSLANCLIFHDNFLSVNSLQKATQNAEHFSSYQELKSLLPIDFIFSFGGDGSFIDTAKLVADLNIPIVGINTGRIGFLTTISKNFFSQKLSLLLQGEFSIEERKLLHITSSKSIDLETCFALNDIIVHSSDDISINGIKLWVNDQMVNTYWADGLIIATPTGSTAYSLSCGGPIIHPETDVNIITPISSHTLAVRPIIINSNDIIKLQFLSRSHKFILSVDSTRIIVENPIELTIEKENFTIKTIRFPEKDFYGTIREKLMWGADIRSLEPES